MDFATYNVCSGVAVRIRDVASVVCDLMGKPQRLLAFGARPYRPDESMCIVGDPGLFQAATGWTPKVSLEEGIGRMIAQSNSARMARVP
jgi:nucleoside-diphosphate-sugar epimerase